MKRDEGYVVNEKDTDETIHEETIAVEDQLPHELMNADAEILECKSLVVDVPNGHGFGAKVWLDGHETYVSAVSFELSAGSRPSARIEFMPKKLFVRWKDPKGKTHVQAVIDNRIVGRWPAERLAGHPALVFDVEELDDAGNPI